MLIDTHCHLNLADAFPDPAQALDEAREAGVGGFVVVGIDAESSTRSVALAEQHDDVWAVVGIHPNSCAGYERAWLDPIRDLAIHPRAVAIGEIGLDYHWDFASPVEQMRSLHDQLDLAAELGLPVVFHCRDAYEDLLVILQARPVRPYLMHCYSGDLDQAHAFAALGAIFGVDGPISYKSASSLREIVRSIGPHRFVLETDSPYLPPEPFRGKPNSPAKLPWIARALAATLSMDEAEIAKITTETAVRFFRLADRGT